LLIPKRHGQTDGRLTVASPRSALASRGKKGSQRTEQNRWTSSQAICREFNNPRVRWPAPKVQKTAALVGFIISDRWILWCHILWL